MSLAVPGVVARRTSHHGAVHSRAMYPSGGNQTPATNEELANDLLDVHVDLNRHEVIFDNSQEACPVRKGDWVVITISGMWKVLV